MQEVIIVPHRITWSWYTGRWWVGCYIWYNDEGTGSGRSPPRPLLTVPNVTAYPSTASVPITVLLYNGSLLCGFNLPIKWLIIIIIMVLSSCQSHCESSPGLFDEYRMAPSGRRPKTKPDHLGCESACTGCQKLHPPSPFIVTTQPESWYLYYRPTQGRRLRRPSWLVTYRDGLPVHRRSPILVLTGSDVAELRWLRPMRYH